MGHKFIVKWKEKSLAKKVLIVSILVLSISVIVLAIMQITGLWNNAIYVFEPLMGVVMILNALNIYKYNKRAAFFNFAVAVFIFIITFVIIII